MRLLGLCRFLAAVGVVLATFIAWSRPAWAQNENETVGFQTNHIFESGQFGENIDVLNGGLNLTVPIGQRFQVNNRLGYQLNLSYNSKVWDTYNFHSSIVSPDSDEVVPFNEGPLGIGFGLHLGRIFVEPRLIPTCDLTEYDSCWTKSYIWVSPDGSQHEFYHDDAISDHGWDSTGVFWDPATGPKFSRRATTDNTFTLISGPANAYCYPSSNTDCFRVETPDGLVYSLAKKVDCENPASTSSTPISPENQSKNHSFCGWYTTLIEDPTVGTRLMTGVPPSGKIQTPFPNHLKVLYDDQRSGFEHAIARIEDSAGRALIFNNCEWEEGGNQSFANRCKATPSSPASRHAVVTRSIELPGFGQDDDLSSSDRVVYTFTYELSKVKRGYLNAEGACNPFGSPPILAGCTSWPVAKLMRVDYPDVVKALGGTDHFSTYFGYVNTSPNRCDSESNELCASDADCGGETGSCVAGAHNGDYAEVTCRTLPIARLTGSGCGDPGVAAGIARYKYSYDYYQYVASYFSGGRAPKKVPCNVSGPEAPGTQCGNLAGASGIGGLAPNGFTRQLVRKTVELPAGSPAGIWTYDRGVSTAFTNPHTVVVMDPVGNDTVYQYHGSRASSDTSNSGGGPDDGYAPEWRDGMSYRTDYYEGRRLTGRLVRSETVEYDADRYYKDLDQRSKANLRPSLNRTEHLDDGGQQITTSRSDWDQDVGRWRLEVVSGFGLQVPRTTKSLWTKGGIYKPEPLVVEVSDGTRVLSRTDNSYDTVGRLQQRVERSVLPGSIGSAWSMTAYSGDRVTTYTYGLHSGNVTGKTLMSGGGFPSYSIAYTYGPVGGTCQVEGECGGYLATKRFLNGASWKSIDRTRDGNTGQIFKSRDTAGVETEYEYDDIGRVTAIRPTGEDATTIDYVSLFETAVIQGNPNSSNYVFVRHRYDALGRLIANQKRPADASQYACQKKEYDILGRVLYETEWMLQSPGACSGPINHPSEKGTTYEYTDPVSGKVDPFGRPRKIIPAEDDPAAGDKSTTMVYFGTSSQVTVNGVRGPGSVPFSTTTSFYRDALDRLQTVDAPPGGADASYVYDTLDRLTEVDLVDDVWNPTTHQVRRFAFDGLGQTTWSENPENGTVAYLDYDALGNLLRLQDAAGNQQRFEYDFAGRLLKKRVTPVGSIESIVFEKYYDDTSFGRSLGKVTLIRSRAENGTSTLEERFTYSDPDDRGLLSDHEHLFVGWPSGLVEKTHYEYNTLGQISRIAYPKEDPATARSTLAVTYSYSNGVVTTATEEGIGTVLGRVFYNPAGGISRVDTPGGGRTEMLFDTLNRPTHLTIGQKNSGGTAWARPVDYDSGTYRYDGAGNIYAIGENRYDYDGHGRLVNAFTRYSQSMSYIEGFSYDVFGNITGANRSTIAGTILQESELYEHSGNRIVSRETTYGGAVTAAEVTFGYDANGNMLVGGRRFQVVAGGPVVTDIKGYDYDAQNRILRINQLSGSGPGESVTEIGRYEYDFGGNRIWKLEAGSGLKTYYVRDMSGQVLSEFRRMTGTSAAPEWAADYVYLGGRLLALKENLKPEPPRGLRGQTSPSGTGHRITLTWDENSESDLNSYKIYRKREGIDSAFIMLWQVTDGPGPTISYLDTTVHATNQVVSYYVTALDGIGYESDPSKTMKVVAGDSTRPNAPFLVGSGGNHEVRLTFNAVTDNSDVIGYEVYRGQAPSSGADTIVPLTLLTSSLISGSPYVDVSVHNATTYYYRVRAIDAAGNGGFYSCKAGGNPCDISVTPHDMTPPSIPKNVTGASTCGSGGVPETIDVSWEANPSHPTYSVRYDIYRSNTPVFSGVTALERTSSTTFHDPGPLTAGVTYFYAIKALHVVAGTNPEQVITESVLSEPSGATPRDSSRTPQVHLFAETSDGQVDLTWQPDPMLPGPGFTPQTVFVYRRPNANRSCNAFVRVGEMNGDWTATYPDATPSNNIAYDYAISILYEGKESSLSRPTLAIPLARPRNMFQCGAHGIYGQDSASGQTVVQWTPPGAVGYQPLYTSSWSDTRGYLKGYHLYNYKACPARGPSGNFQDNSPLRQLLVKAGDPVDPYLIQRTGFNLSGDYEYLDTRFAVGPSATFTPVLEPGIDTLPWLDCGGHPDPGFACAIPKAVYKVYAEGTWLTVESDWPDYFDPFEVDPVGRCDTPLRMPSPELPECRDASTFSSFVPPPRRVVAEESSPGSISISWVAPTIPAGRPPIGGFLVYARSTAIINENSPSLNAIVPVAVTGPGESAVTVDDLWMGPTVADIAPNSYSFRVATVDQAGAVSGDAMLCESTGNTCQYTFGCTAMYCSTSGRSCTAGGGQCAYGRCSYSQQSCSAGGSCAAAVCSNAISTTCTPVRRVYVATGHDVDGSVHVGFPDPHPANGNTLVAVVATRGTSNNRVTSISQTGATWLPAEQKTNVGGVTIEVWYASNIQNADDNVDVALAAPLEASVAIGEYIGILTTGLDRKVSATGSGAVLSTGSTATTSQDSEIWVAGMAVAGERTLSGFSNGFIASYPVISSPPAGDTDVIALLLDRVATQQGTGEVSANLNSGSMWAAALVTFRAATPESTQCGGGTCEAQSCDKDVCQTEICSDSGGRWCKNQPDKACNVSRDCSPKWLAEGHCNITMGTWCNPDLSTGCPTGEVCVGGDQCVNVPLWVSARPGDEESSPSAPNAVRQVVWTLGDGVVANGRDGVKLAWQPGRPGASNSAIQGFRVYRSDTGSPPYCVLTDSGTANPPLPVARCSSQVAGRTIDQDAYSSDISTPYGGMLAVHSYWDRTAKTGKTYYYRVTQLESSGGPAAETPLGNTFLVPAKAFDYDRNVLPPPQGFQAWAPQSGALASDQQGIALAWCPVPSSTDVPGSDLPALGYYNVYRTGYDGHPYRLLAKISKECLDSGKRCEITNGAACIDQDDNTLKPGCTPISPPTDPCGGSGQKRCGVVDVTFKDKITNDHCWPSIYTVDDEQKQYQYRYYVTAMTTGAVVTESMPSRESHGWPNYCATVIPNPGGGITDIQNCVPAACLLRRDPEGDGGPLVCGNENAELRVDEESLEDQTAVSVQRVAPVDSEHGPEAGYRVIGLPPVCEDCEGGNPPPPNPYNPPARFVFYHQDHLRNPRVVLDGTGAKIAVHHYLPFGEERPSQLDPTLNDRGFTGQVRDVETGLDYMLARYYASSMARFMAVDPSSQSIDVSTPQSWNRYSYAANNPIRYIDPDGKHNAEGHETIVESALGASMSPDAVQDVTEGNLAVDAQPGSMTCNDAASTNQHGLAGKKADGTWQTPGEAAAGAATFVDTKVASAAEKALDGDMSEARHEMGAATHTVADSTAGGHDKQQRWNGALTILSPKGALHGLNDMMLTAGERIDGVAATRSVHGRVESTIREMGQSRGLSEAAIADTIKAFNGR